MRMRPGIWILACYTELPHFHRVIAGWI
jgi:hypothetical protein